MKRNYAQKSPFCRHTHDTTKSPLLNKTNRLVRKSSTISAKKAIKENNYYHHPYSTKKKRGSFCSTNNSTDTITKCITSTTTTTTTSNHSAVQEDLANVDPTYLSTLRHEAYDELHRQMQQYNDSFVIRMQQAEQQRHDNEHRPSSQHRRRSFHRRQSPLISPSSLQHSHHHRPRLYCCHQEDNESGIEDLVDMLESGTIKDYSLLTEWELCQNPQIELEEEQHGGFGDLW